MKQYTATAFTARGGQLLNRWTDAPPPTFTAGTGAGPADLTVALPRRPGSGSGLVDDFGGHYDVVLRNYVEYRVQDVDTPAAAFYGDGSKYGGPTYGVYPGSGALLYGGIVRKVTPTFAPGKESVTALLTSASRYIGNGLIDSITFDPIDPVRAAKQIIRQYVPGCSWHPANPAQLPGPALGLSLTLANTKVKDALDALILLAGLNWYWTVWPDGSVRFDAAHMTTPDHTFIVGQHVESFEPTNSIYDSYDRVVEYGAPILATQPDYPPVATASTFNPADPSILVEAQTSITDMNVLTLMGQNKLAAVSQPQWQGKATIFDSNVSAGSLPAGVSLGYDIESIHVGDTCRFIYPGVGTPMVYGAGVDYGSGRYGATSMSGQGVVFMVAGITYSLDNIQLELGNRQYNAGRWLAVLNNTLLQRLATA